MRIAPELDEMVNGQRGILKGIELCLSHECLVSAVALIFSGVDSLAALIRPIDAADTSRAVFIEWVERFLLPQSALTCTALDLYAARCGVLHTYSAESTLSRRGDATQLVYVWRDGPTADASVPLPSGALSITAEDLHEAFRMAVDRFFVAADTDPEIGPRARHHLKALLCYRPWPVLTTSAYPT